jgi:TolB-like protein/DNA-binding winged helix-turn-helix (wHTH) protein
VDAEKVAVAASVESEELFAFGPFVLDRGRAALLRDGVEIPLRPKSFDVLCCLVTRAGRVVGREELLDAVWPGLIVTDDSLTQCVTEIRKVLGDEGHELIRTVPRKGYLFELPVERLARPGAASGTRPATGFRKPDRSLHRYLMAAVAAAIVLAGVGLWYLGAFRPAAEGEAPAFDPPPHSIAVLPFADLSPAGDREYLADGISEEILNALTQIPGLTVIARTSSFAFKGATSSIREVARRLNVAYVLEGSVRTEGDTARVTAQLVSAGEEAHLWSRTFDLPLTSAFDLQSRVAKTLLGAVARDLNVEPPPAVEDGGHRPDPNAWQHVQRGRFFYARRGEGDIERALREFDAAIEADPRFADAWAERGSALLLLGLLGVGEYSPDDPAIRAALERALSLDENNPEALIRMVQVEWIDGQQERYSHYLDLAIQRGHNSPLVQGMLAGMALAAFELERAVALQRRAAALDPLWV